MHNNLIIGTRSFCYFTLYNHLILYFSNCIYQKKYMLYFSPCSDLCPVGLWLGSNQATHNPDLTQTNLSGSGLGPGLFSCWKQDRPNWSPESGCERSEWGHCQVSQDLSSILTHMYSRRDTNAKWPAYQKLWMWGYTDQFLTSSICEF